MRAGSTWLALLLALTGCAGYDQWAENTNRKINAGWTELLYGEQSVDTSAVPKGFTINIAYGKGEGRGLPGSGTSPFVDKLLGDLTYNKGCPKMLSFNVGLFNDAGAMIRNEKIVIGPYQANIKALIDKDVFTDPMMNKSSQVTRLVVSEVKCS
jgi:hypothetical protein